MADCICGTGPADSGVSKCKAAMDVTKAIYAVQRIANDNTPNGIAVGTVLNAAFWTALINHTDPSKRFYPITGLDNVENLRADSIVQTTSGGRNIRITEGVRAFQGDLIGSDPKYKAVLDSWACADMMIYTVDKSENVWGQESADGTTLDGMPIDSNTIDAKFGFTTDSTLQFNQLNFEFSESMKDEKIGYFAANEITGIDLLTQQGLMDVNTTVSLETTTSFTVTMVENYGTAKTKNAVQGYLIGDFTLVEVTPTPGPIVITTVVESAPGVYDFVIPVETSLDVLSLTAARDGFDFPTTTITIP